MPAATDRDKFHNRSILKIGVPNIALNHDPDFRRGVPVVVDVDSGIVTEHRFASDIKVVYKITTDGTNTRIESLRRLPRTRTGR